MVSSLEIEILRFPFPVIKAQIVELGYKGASTFVNSSLICYPVEIENGFFFCTMFVENVFALWIILTVLFKIVHRYRRTREWIQINDRALKQIWQKFDFFLSLDVEYCTWSESFELFVLDKYKDSSVCPTRCRANF